MGIEALIIQTTGFNDIAFMIDKNMNIVMNDDETEWGENKKTLEDAIEEIKERSNVGDLMHHKLTSTNVNRRKSITHALKKAYQESLEHSQVKPNSGLERYLNSTLDYLKFVIENERKHIEGKRRVLFALHSEPESSNHPLSSDIGSQSILLDLIASNKSLDIRIREHPLMFDMDNANVIASTDKPYISVVRDGHFKKIIEENSNIAYAYHDENIIRQIKDSDLFICLNGSLALEALCCKNKTVVSSKSWLHGAPGTVTIEELEEGNIDKYSR